MYVVHASYGPVRAAVGVGPVLIWDFSVAITKGGGVYKDHWEACGRVHERHATAPSAVVCEAAVGGARPCVAPVGQRMSYGSPDAFKMHVSRAMSAGGGCSGASAKVCRSPGGRLLGGGGGGGRSMD